MKSKFFFLVLFTAICSVASAQTKLAGDFQINGDISTIKSAYKVFLSYRSKGDNVSDSALVVNGRFMFKGNLNEPTEGNFLLVKKPDNGKLSYKDLIGGYGILIEPEIITIKAIDTVFEHAKTTGSILTDYYLELDKEYHDYHAPQRALYEQLKTIDTANHSAKEKIYAQIQSYDDHIADSLYKPFMLAHLDDFMSVYALKQYIGMHMNATKVEPLYEKLHKRFQELPSGRWIKTTIDASKTNNVGQMAADFTQADTSGNMIGLSSFKGKYVLLDFWASWCGPCRAENPNVVKAYNHYKNKNFTILSISVDKNRDDWLKAVKEDDLQWTQIIDTKSANSISAMYGIIGIPQNFLIDPNGKIVAKSLRGDDLEKELDKVLGQ